MQNQWKCKTKGSINAFLHRSTAEHVFSIGFLVSFILKRHKIIIIPSSFHP